MRNYIVLIVTIFFCFSCVNRTNNQAKVDFNQTSNNYAQLFTLSDSGSYKRLDIKSPWQGGTKIVYSYYLVGKGAELPWDIPEDKIINVPISKTVCMSTSHIAMIDALSEANGVVGVSGADYVSNKIVRERIERGEVKDIGYDSNLNNELIAGLNPDVILVYGIGAESAGYIAKLKEAGVKTLYICDYMEVHPLARTEWLKVYGALFCKDQESQRIFDSISLKYESICNDIDSLQTYRPKVMLGLPFKDSWFVSPGNSYISKLISDAGASYLWKDQLSQASMPLGLESVYLKGMESDYWLNTGTAQSIKDLIGVDSRFTNLPAVKEERIYNNIAKLNLAGGNEYWESGVMSPDIILLDLASIFQPDIINDHKLVYYSKLK